MGKGDASNKVMAKVPPRYKRVATTPKFKRRKVSAVRDFPPGCGRVTTSTLDYVGESQSINLVKESGSQSLG
ncbi:hypothetical protein J1N35_004835 [Gossypium stocksii]|uniref:Uncharacterized protein n=1 Tax=Gossypium stocksii TaxID=47602 RepID=A0A9D3WE73_9ROSI|nr:hypothetical protein J1N35_004835 [Gossypium stocksii]